MWKCTWYRLYRLWYLVPSVVPSRFRFSYASNATGLYRGAHVDNVTLVGSRVSADTNEDGEENALDLTYLLGRIYEY